MTGSRRSRVQIGALNPIHDLATDDAVAAVVTTDYLRRPAIASKAMADDTARHAVNEAQFDRFRQQAQFVHQEAAPQLQRMEHSAQFPRLRPQRTPLGPVHPRLALLLRRRPRIRPDVLVPAPRRLRLGPEDDVAEITATQLRSVVEDLIEMGRWDGGHPRSRSTPWPIRRAGGRPSTARNSASPSRTPGATRTRQPCTSPTRTEPPARWPGTASVPA